MTTITAVELRKNMAEVFRRVASGEEIAVTYRGGQRFVIKQDEERKRRPMQGLQRLLEKTEAVSTLDKTKSIKELYHESLDEQFGKKY